MSLSDSTSRKEFKKKIRSELNKGLEKEHIFSEEDRILIYKVYKKIKKELSELETNNN